MDDLIINAEMTDKINMLPFNMTVSDLAEFLGVCPATAYKIAKSSNFPRLKMPGRRLVIIPKPLFLEWYKANCVPASQLEKN